MPERLVDAGAAFYASDLGQRLVGVENASHDVDLKTRLTQGQKLVVDMMDSDPGRLETLKLLNRAVGSTAVTERAMVEIQVRFTMAAMAAGALSSDMSEKELRRRLTQAIHAQAPQMDMMSLLENAFTYRGISDADLSAYVTALKSDDMQQVYQALNATQYQIMLERYQVLGSKMGDLQPQQDL